MVEHEIEEEEAPSNVTVSYNVGPGHELYNPNGAVEHAWEELRNRRKLFLKKVDKYQGVLLYATLTETQQEELATYRQSLLDLTSDYDDPAEAMANLPTRPSWFS